MAEKGKLQSSTLFKQIGVDVDFVAQNANDSNNRLNDLYWNKTSGQRHGSGGQIENVKLPKNLSMIRNYDVDVNHAAVRSMAGGDASYAAAPNYGQQQQHHQPQVAQHAPAQHTLQLDATVAAPGAPAQVSFDHSMITQLKAEIMQELANQVGGLASKMQQFADQTDRAISELQRQAQSAAVNPTPKAARPAEDLSNNPAAAKLAQQNAIDPHSVSVSKMFNFSHSGGSGKRV